MERPVSMKQIVQYVNTGELKIEDVPCPALRRGGVLVASRYSLVSTGTERMAIDLAKKSLVGKALERPDLVKQVIQKMKTEGVGTTIQKVRTKLDAPIPLGYSCAGVVVAVAEDVDDFQVGDTVACAGQGYASHAEVVFVPRNLCVKIPEGVDLDEAAYVTLGAIAMQGVRIAEVTLGESVLIIGLGLLGQIALQILKSAGCKVLAVDIDESKVELARKFGADAAALRGKDDVKAIAEQLSRGRGIDAAIITAGTSSNDPIELAAEVLRDRGRVSVVGAVKMDLPRKPYYEKELQVRLSRSYGPGRYDPAYEEKGVDYPIGYVRWTERRNMESFLDMIASGAVRPRELTTHTFEIADAISAYDLIGGKSTERSLGILLKYPEEPASEGATCTLRQAQDAKQGVKAGVPRDKVRIGMIGAGGFGQAVMLPNLAKIVGAELRAIAALDGIEAKRAGERFGARYAATSAEEVISDAEVDAVIIATRHDMHVPLATKALEAGKHVFLEKPLALNSDELDSLIAAHEKSGREIVVDFNRRRSPLVTRLRNLLARRSRPLVMFYRVNAGFIPKDSWIQDSDQGGGRIIGEVCHFIDLMQHICGGRPTEVYAAAAYADNEYRMNHDSVLVTVKFSDGSVGTIAYASDGNPKMPKERLEVLGQGSSCVIDDFKTGVFLANGKTENVKLKSQDKGHAIMLEAFVDMVAGRAESPVPFGEAVSATRATFAVLESLGLGTSVAVE